MCWTYYYSQKMTLLALEWVNLNSIIGFSKKFAKKFYLRHEIFVTYYQNIKLKRMRLFWTFVTLVFIATIDSTLVAQTDELDGAWSLNGAGNHLLLIQDGYFSWTETGDQDDFVRTIGGILNQEDGQFDLTIQFNSEDGDLVGESFTTQFSLEDKKLTTRHPEGHTMTWERIDESDQGLAGVWRITGRKRNGEVSPMTRRPRKTYKILTGEHFQWVAMNTETGAFSGTGGGTYSFKDGKYTENIGFFSRDNSRVGASLVFDGQLKNGEWHHSGKSSKGDPIYEIWSKETDYINN